MTHLQLRHLRYFIAVSEKLNFRVAGEALCVSQPTLSQQIAQLEQLLGFRLLKRDKHHVELTEPGKLFYEEALMILETVEESITRARSLAGVQPLRVGVPNYHSFDIVSKAVRVFSQAHPGSQLDISELSSMEMYDSLNNEKLDVGFISVPMPVSHGCKLKSHYLGSEPFLICLPPSHPANQSDELTISDIKDSKFFLLARKVHPSFHDMIVKSLRAAGFRGKISCEATSTQAQYGLVAADRGVCLALVSSPLPKGLRALPINPPLDSHDLALAWHPNCTHSGLQTFISTTVESVQPLEP